MKKAQGNNGTNPVEAAQAALAEAQARLASHDERKRALDEERAHLTEALDRATLGGDAKASDQTARDLAKVSELAASVIRVRGPLALAVEGAEQRLAAAERSAAHAEVQRLAKEIADLNAQVIETLTEVLFPLLHQKKGCKDRMAELAIRHDLPSPPQGILLVPRNIIREDAAEELRDALDPVRVFGADARQPAP